MALLTLWRRTAYFVVLREANHCARSSLCTLLPASATGLSKWSAPHPFARISTSPAPRGLEEFFPKTDDIIEEGEAAGRSWRASDLRQKSNEDLHKLWYVLLKERNMLLTLEKEANRLRYQIPAPERKHKVVKSMARLKYVLHERALAISEAKKELGLVPQDNDENELKKQQKKRQKKQAKHKARRNMREHRKIEQKPDFVSSELESVSSRQ